MPPANSPLLQLFFCRAFQAAYSVAGCSALPHAAKLQDVPHQAHAAFPAAGLTQVVRLHLPQPRQQRGVQLGEQTAQLLLLRGRPGLGRRPPPSQVLHMLGDAVVGGAAVELG